MEEENNFTEENCLVDLIDSITWIEIFKYLDGSSIVFLSESCLKFHEIISNSRSLMKKIKFKISFPDEIPDELEKIRKGLMTCDKFIRRKYLNLKIVRLNDKILNSDDVIRHTFYAIMEKLHSVFTLELQNCYLPREDVVLLLQPFNNLIELKLENIMFSDDLMPSEIVQESELNFSLNVPNLKILKLIQCDFYCLLLLKCHSNLHTLEISFPSYNRSDVEELENFLLKQSDLKELKLTSFRFNSSYSTNRLSNVPFQLEKLILKDVSFDILDHGSLFLKSQKKLQHFELRRFQRWIQPKEVNFLWFSDIMRHILIFNPLVSLIIESIQSYAYIKDQEFLTDANYCNNTLTKLTYIRDSSDVSEFFNIFSRIFPNVEYFEFNEGNINTISVLDNLYRFKNLRRLNLTAKPSSLNHFSMGTASNLTSLKFNATNEDKSLELLKQIFSKNFILEELHLNIEPLTIEEIIDLIMKFSSTLQHLKIYDLHMNASEAELFIKNFPKLKHLSSDIPPSLEVLKLLASSRITFRLIA